jgi:glycosyltransferase involved in cell wall biosynthesis
MTDPTEFVFDRRQLARPRPVGISAIMRIKNGEPYLRQAIESHLPHYDEIVACYNDCSDGTERILNELAALHPDKVKVYPYLPRVHPALSAEHEATPTESVNGLANYYNYALSKASFSYAAKLDDDHLAFDGTVGPALGLIRRQIARGARRLYLFSGLNLARNEAGELGVLASAPFAGVGDHMFFPVSERAYFRQAPRCEQFHVEGPRLEKLYVGLLYAHVKYAKPDLGLGYLTGEARQRELEAYRSSFRWQRFEEFASDASIGELIGQAPRLEYLLRTHRFTRGIVYAVTRRHPLLRLARLARLKADLDLVDFERDVLRHLA